MWGNVCDSQVAMCVGRALGPCTVDDENLAGGLGQAEGLHQSLEAREWFRVRCSGLDDAYRVVRTHKGVLSFASVGRGELHAVLQDAYDRWTWERACDRIPALTLVGGPPLTASLKLAMQHLRTSGEHLARSVLEFVFLGTMRAKTWSGWNGFHWIAAASFVKRRLARCGKDATSAPHLQSSHAATARTSTWTNGSTACRLMESKVCSVHDSC